MSATFSWNISIVDKKPAKLVCRSMPETNQPEVFSFSWEGNSPPRRVAWCQHPHAHANTKLILPAIAMFSAQNEWRSRQISAGVGCSSHATDAIVGQQSANWDGRELSCVPLTGTKHCSPDALYLPKQDWVLFVTRHVRNISRSSQCCINQTNMIQIKPTNGELHSNPKRAWGNLPKYTWTRFWQSTFRTFVSMHKTSANEYSTQNATFFRTLFFVLVVP